MMWCLVLIAALNAPSRKGIGAYQFFLSAHYTSLKVNFDKLYLIPRGMNHRAKAAFSASRHEGQRFSPAFGEIRRGHPAIGLHASHQESHVSGTSNATQDITLTERLALLELWILPLLPLPARLVFPYKAVAASLQSVYHTVLRTIYYLIMALRSPSCRGARTQGVFHY